MKISSEIPNDTMQRCSHNLLYTIYVRTYQEPSPVGEGGSRRLTDEVSVSLLALYILLRTNKRKSSNPPVGTGRPGNKLPHCPFRYESNFFPRRTVEDACPYNE